MQSTIHDSLCGLIRVQAHDRAATFHISLMAPWELFCIELFGQPPCAFASTG